jgi:hypothetical protein
VPRGKRMPTVEQVKRERDALELRRAGLDYAAIAQRLNFANKGSAHKAVSRALQRTNADVAEDLRSMEADRLDRLQAAMWGPALQGSAAAVDRVLRIMERRAKLLGLDAPTSMVASAAGDGSLTVMFGFNTADPAAADASAVPEAELPAIGP